MTGIFPTRKFPPEGFTPVVSRPEHSPPYRFPHYLFPPSIFPHTNNSTLKNCTHGIPPSPNTISALRTLSSLGGLRGAPAVPPLCRETQSLGQHMLELSCEKATVGTNGLSGKWESLHTERLQSLRAENIFRNLIKSNRNQIVFTIF